MGLTSVEGIVRGPGVEASVTFLVDSGATSTLLPNQTWRAIGLSPTRSVEFSLAVLGEPGDEALLGIVTLEILGPVLHPFGQELRPMRMLLA